MNATQLTKINHDPEIMEPVTELKLRDGLTYGLYFDLDAIVWFFQETGKNILAGDLTPDDFTSVDTIVKITKAGTLRLHENLTEEQIRTGIDIKNLRYVLVKLNQALLVVMPEKKSEEAGPVSEHPLPVTRSSVGSEQSSESGPQLVPESSDD